MHGLTLVELLVALALAGLIVLGLSGVVGTALHARQEVRERDQLSRQAHFAMQRMVQSVTQGRGLMLPLADNPATDWREHVREQTVPASPPEGSSSLATAVLAVLLPLTQDLDGNGIADADNDADGLVDEDLPNDASNDAAHGIVGIDDNGNGVVDDGQAVWGNDDDDEDGSANEDTANNNNDDDGDGSSDEDPMADMNADLFPGIRGVDDDGDGEIDEGGIFNSWDDDEDGARDEDWHDPKVFYLEGGTLMERTPVPWDENADTKVDGLDFIASPLAENVTYFRVERVEDASAVSQLVDITLELTDPRTNETTRLNTRMRLGAAF